jgi:CheY-like chemotaxis protein
MIAKANRPVVLVVEDEPLALMLAMDIIDDMGFMAVAAPNADEAIAIMERRGDIQIVFTDVNMPGSMDGIGLAHVVRRRWPPVRILVASGRPLREPNPLPDGIAFLQKPYSLRAVEVSLHGMLD